MKPHNHGDSNTVTEVTQEQFGWNGYSPPGGYLIQKVRPLDSLCRKSLFLLYPHSKYPLERSGQEGSVGQVIKTQGMWEGLHRESWPGQS